MGCVLLTKGDKSHGGGSGLLPNSTSQAQLHRRYPTSIKGKKVLARGLSQSSRGNVQNSLAKELYIVSYTTFETIKETSISSFRNSRSISEIECENAT